VDNQVRLQLFALAYNLGNFLRRLALPRGVKHWSLTTLREKLIKIGAKVVAHSRYVIFQMAEVAVPKRLFQAILDRIRQLGFRKRCPGERRRRESLGLGTAAGNVCQYRPESRPWSGYRPESGPCGGADATPWSPRKCLTMNENVRGSWKRPTAVVGKSHLGNPG
jgi:hypothetical protein